MDKSFPGLKLISPAIGLKLTHRKTNFLPPHWHWFHFSQWQTVAFQWQPHKRHHHPRVLQRVAGKSGKHEQCKLMQNAAFNTFERKLPSFHSPPPPLRNAHIFFPDPRNLYLLTRHSFTVSQPHYGPIKCLQNVVLYENPLQAHTHTLTHSHTGTAAECQCVCVRLCGNCILHVTHVCNNRANKNKLGPRQQR